MNNFKATPEQWQASEKRAASGHLTDLRVLELRSRVEALESQANHSPGATKMVPVAKVTRDRDETGNYVIVHDTATPPPVATDEELQKIWNSERACRPWVSRRAIYNLGAAHEAARWRNVAEPAPVAGEMEKSLAMALGLMASQATKAGQLEDAQILRHAAAMLMERSEQEAGR